AKQGIGLVYGGGNVGLMGVIADAALHAGGEVIGVIPSALMDKELGHLGVTKLHVVGSMHERKQLMADLSEGFIALPGGIGTLEELFETFTWLQLGFHSKPVGLLNIAGFYDHLLTFLRHALADQFLRTGHLESLLVESGAGVLLERMSRFRATQISKWKAEPPSPAER
ncbi:MAG: TIGR00730 family Rossman fold protein, partial [Chthoniobacteraceae bacterium]